MSDPTLMHTVPDRPKPGHLLATMGGSDVVLMSAGLDPAWGAVEWHDIETGACILDAGDTVLGGCWWVPITTPELVKPKGGE